MRADGDAAPSKAATTIAAILAILALAPVAMWPGDVPFTTDEPRLLAQAWHANHAHVLASAGLTGNFGVPYGPLPTQIYQLLLLLTHDAPTLVVLRGLLCGGITAFSLLWLARTLRLPGWFAACILVAPYITHFHRVLWDASFTVPLTALIVAAFADHLASGRARSLRVCVAGVLLLPLIHPQGLPLTAAVGGYLLWRKRSELWGDRRALAWLGAAFFALHATYLPKAFGGVLWRFSHGSGATYPGTGSRLLSALSPALGGRLLACNEKGVPLYVPHTPGAAFVELLEWLSRLIYPLIWVGLALAIWRAGAVMRHWRAPAAAPAVSVRDEVAVVLLGAAAMQAALFAALRIPIAPQYFFASFGMLVFFAWLAVGHRWWFRCVGAAYGSGVLLLTLGQAIQVHALGYAAPDWILLRNYVALAQDANRYANPEALTDIPILQRAPQTLRTLRLLYPPAAGASPRTSERLLVRFRMTLDAPLELEFHELPPGELPPRESKPLDLTPLPRDWVPDRSTW